MSGHIIYSLVAFAALVPATVLALVGRNQRSLAFWWSLILATSGPIVWLVIRSEGVWRSDFSSALWITISFTLICYGIVAVLTRQGSQLSSIVMPYMALLALIAAIWETPG